MKYIITTYISLLLCAVTSLVNAQTVSIGQTSYNTIATAITAASEGDVIDITGIHTETITVNKNITIKGTDPSTDIIQAAADLASATKRVIIVNGGGDNVKLENITVRYGSMNNPGGGIYIENATQLVELSNVVVENNKSTKNGGGIAALGSVVKLTNCTVQNNESIKMGGGIILAPKNNSTAAASFTIENTLIANNTSTENGGGLAVEGGLGNAFSITGSVSNTTIAFNQSSGKGGGAFIKGIALNGATNTEVTIKNATVAYNTATEQNGFFFYGVNASAKPLINIYSSIISLNGANEDIDIPLGGANANEIMYNIFGTSGGMDGAANSTGTVSGKFNDVLKLSAGLVDKEGKTKVLTIEETSLAVDFSDATVATAKDALGTDRTTPDAGAYEFATEDEVDPEDPIDPDPVYTVFIGETGYMTITEALNAAVEGDVIKVEGVHTESINIQKNVTIEGEDPSTDIIQAADDVANATDRVITVNGNGDNVTIKNLTVRNGNAAANGGGIYIENAISATLTNVVIEGNQTAKNGAGLMAAGSNVVLEGCVVKGNTATALGGGLAFSPKNNSEQDITIDIKNSSVTGNTAGTNGGGISIDGSKTYGDQFAIAVNVENTTVAFNTAAKGGAFYTKGVVKVETTETNTSLTVNQSTVVYNTATTDGFQGFYFFTAADALDGKANFNLNNSIVSLNGEDTKTDIDFNNSVVGDLKNNILGLTANTDGLDLTTSEINQFADEIKLSSTLSTVADKLVEVLTFEDESIAIDFADENTATAKDALGTDRELADAGAYESSFTAETEPEPFDPVNTVFIGETQYYTIAEAVVAATEGDIIKIAGVHTESVTIDKHVTLEGTDPAMDIIQGATTLAENTGSRVITVTANIANIKNLTIRNGYAKANAGGGMLVDSSNGLVILSNLTIEQNKADKSGGALSVTGANVLIKDCRIQNNEAVKQGGGLNLVPKNSVGHDATVQIKNSLVAYNTAGTNGGGITIDGNNKYGNDYLMSAEIENTTIAFNTATQGGAIFTKGALKTDTEISNIQLSIRNATVAYNTATNASKGLHFAGTGNAMPLFSMYNSIVSLNGEDADNDMNTTAAVVSDIKNCILGTVSEFAEGINTTGTETEKYNDYLQLSSELVDMEGLVKILFFGKNSGAIDFADAATATTTDALGIDRETPDAGAFEFFFEYLIVDMEELTISLNNDSGAKSDLLLSFEGDCSPVVSQPAAFRIYAKDVDTELASQCLSVDSEVVVPLYIDIETYGEYFVTLENWEEYANLKVAVQDITDGRNKILDNITSFSFLSDVTTAEHRLNLVISPEDIVMSTSLAEKLESLQLTTKSNELILNGKVLEMDNTQLVIMDLMGRVLKQETLVKGASQKAVPFNFHNNQVYIIKLSSSAGSLVKKITF